MTTSAADGPRVKTRHRGYNLRSGRHIEYDSPLVSRVPRSPARDASDNSVGSAIIQGWDMDFEGWRCEASEFLPQLLCESNSRHYWIPEVETEADIENSSKQVWPGLVHFGHHHGQEATMAWSSWVYEWGEVAEDVVWGAEKEKSMLWDKKEVEGPDVKRPAGDWFEERLVPSVSGYNRMVSVMSRRSGWSSIL